MIVTRTVGGACDSVARVSYFLTILTTAMSVIRTQFVRLSSLRCGAHALSAMHRTPASLILQRRQTTASATGEQRSYTIAHLQPHKTTTSNCILSHHDDR